MNSLRIASWNIDGCFFRVSGSRLNKLHNDNVLEMIHKVDIAFLVETHCLSTDSLAIKVFDVIQNNRKKHKNAKKGSGGIAVCIRSSIRNGIKILPFTNSEFIWIKLSKVFFNLIFMSVASILPHKDHHIVIEMMTCTPFLSKK